MKDAFRLVIQLGNDAMQSGSDIAEALRKVADLLDDGTQYFDDPTDESGFDRNGRINDTNGNKVGSWSVA